MKKYWSQSIFISLILSLHCVSAWGQGFIELKTGTFVRQQVTGFERNADLPNYLFFSPGHILSNIEKDSLLSEGIEILYALSNANYWVRLSKPLPEKSRSLLFDIDNHYKKSIEPDLRAPTNQLRISIAPGLSMNTIEQWAKENQLKLLDTRAARFGMMDVEIMSSQFEILLETKWISFIEAIPVDEEVNYRLLNAERGWGLKSTLFRGLNGEGMTVGIGDGGRLGIHDDISADVLDLASFGLSDHSTMVTGIVTGTGLIDPAFGSGYAPEAKVLVRNFSDIIWDAPQYADDFDMSLTNNSYSSSPFDCDYIGDYNGTSAGVDAMMNDYKSLLHVFAAGNSGIIQCLPFPLRYATIAGGYQSAKNVLTVGAISATDAAVGFSSRGPVDDGRLKPEIVAHGQNRFSTTSNHNFNTNSGTSFSSPAVMGSATLLYQRYRQLHNDSMPEATLIKNVLCNGADDLGNAGPDFTFGFGRLNGVRSVEILEENRFDSVHVNHNSTRTRSIVIPSGIASIDIMLMWNDPVSAPYETVTLVNDLDLIIIDPSGDTLKPWRLNYDPASVTVPAATGADHLNNYEQVTVIAVAAGTYTIIVKGYEVPMGPQVAWLSWDIHVAGITLQSPIGGEVFRPGNPAVPNDQQYIRWDAFGTGNSTFTAEYSVNGGNSWILIANNIPADRRYHGWFVPNIPSDKFRVRVSATNGMQHSSPFDAVVMAPPTNLMVTSPCDGYIQANWTAVSGAQYYKVYSLKDEVLTELDTTISTSIVLDGFAPTENTRITVAGVFPSGKAGLRARALPVTANGGEQCTWTNDVRVESMLNPVSGREFTSTSLSASETIQVLLSNMGTQNASGFSLSYKINNNAVVTEAFPGTLNPGEGQSFSFTQLANLSALGTYTIKVWTTYAQDNHKMNDTILATIIHLPNPVISLPWNEDFENTIDTTFRKSTTGLTDLSGWDVTLGANCRIRTFAGTPFCHDGSRALTMDAIRGISSESNEVIVTLNMDNYSVANDDIRLSLNYMHHEFIPDVVNTEAVWVRGSDLDPFILVTMLSNDANLRGQWQFISGLEISDILGNAGQEYSGSFQLKFPFEVYSTAGEVQSQDGQTIDDIALEVISRDLRLNEIIHPTTISCGLGMETISVSITNTTSQDVANARIYYQVNQGPFQVTTIGNVPAESNATYQLTPAADFSANGLYHLKVWVAAPTDDYHENDTLEMNVLHSPLVDVFPYKEGFEINEGGWMTSGTNGTWAHGLPGKQSIAHAAEGEKVWTTSLTGSHAADELSYLYSPCFDLNGLSNPFLSFALKYQLEENFDYAWVEYRLENSDTWSKLGVQGNGVNWYNHASNAWNGNQNKWVTSGIAIPMTGSTVQFRWVMQSDEGVELEGIAIDQVHVYNNVPVYTGIPMQWSFPASGNQWIHLEQNNQRVLSIHPQGQNLGTVTLQLFKYNQDFQSGDSLYLLSRNWVLSSTNALIGDIKLRGYFLGSEATNLVNASGCAQCIPSKDAFDVACVRYDGAEEDGIYSNNTTTGINVYSTTETEIVPYDNGYYAEWTTDDLSEWWIATPVTKFHGTIEKRISAGSDDAEEHENNGSVNPIRETLALTDYNGHQRVGLRFRNITIPAGSYITSAKIVFTSSSSLNGPASFVLQSEMSDDAKSFSTFKYHISQRPRSAQVVYWTPVAWTANQEYETPDIRNLIQSVIDQPGWVNGNDLVIECTGTGLREAWSYDGDPDLAALIEISFQNGCSDPGRIYVDGNADGLQDGSGWTNAYRSLEQALDRVAHCPAIDEIWIADGIYSRYFEVPRTSYYSLPSGLKIYGGFQGNETQLNQRIIGAYPTILSGEIGIINQASDNLYHVVLNLAGVETTILDGISIQKGTATGPQPADQTGGGIYNSGILECNQVILQNNSLPSLYNAPGAFLRSVSGLEVKQ